MAHSHSGSGAIDVAERTARLLRSTVIALLVLAVAGAVLLRPGRVPSFEVFSLGEQYDGLVRSNQLGPCPGQGDADPGLLGTCVTTEVELLAGPHEGEIRELILPESPTTPILIRGDKIVLAYEPSAEEGFEYSFIDRQRRAPLFWLTLIFAVAVVALGRLRGLAALGGLVFTIATLLAFVLPAILSGRNPVLVAVVGAALIAYVTLYLAHGFTHMTTVALLGTLVSLALTVGLAEVFVSLTQLSGFTSEESLIVKLSSVQLDASGFVLAGMVLGALGALDDVTVTQASSVWELRAANPAYGVRELYRSALRIGRDHIASTVNTLLLAYAGASMPLLLFFVISERPLLAVANEEVVATEIVRTLVGSIGLVASVPITTWLASYVAARRTENVEIPPPGPSSS